MKGKALALKSSGNMNDFPTPSQKNHKDKLDVALFFIKILDGTWYVSLLTNNMYRLSIFSILFFITLPTSFALGTGTLADSGSIDESKSIKELHDNIKDLKVEKRDLWEKWARFNKESGRINDFIKTSLTEEDKKQLEELLTTYYSHKSELEDALKIASSQEKDSQSVKNNLLKLKLELYKSLTVYVKIEKLKEYVAYIKSNLEIVKEDSQIKDDLYRKEEILWRKVEEVKQKIEANNKLLDEKIKELLTEKISQKINNLLQNPKFIVLEIEKKKAIFQATLQKITEKKESLKNIHDQTTFAQKKVEIYTIVEDKLKEVIAGFWQN